MGPENLTLADIADELANSEFDGSEIVLNCLVCDGINALKIMFKNGRLVYACRERCSTSKLTAALALASTTARAILPKGDEAGSSKNPNERSTPKYERGSGANPAASGPSPSGAAPSKGMLKYAVAYARYHMRVFPCHEIERDGYCSCGATECKSAGKHPRVEKWQELATTDGLQISRWWKQWPTANVGIACGEKSNLTVLDVDGDLGRDTLRALELEHGELPETPIALTGSGGCHYYFIYTAGLNNAVRFAPGLDIRTQGGLIIGVGSRNRHGRYAWESIFTLGADNLQPAAMPQWLLKTIREGQATHRTETGKVQIPTKLGTMIEGSGRDNLLWRTGRSLVAQNMPAAAVRAALVEINNQFAEHFTEREIETKIEHVLSSPNSNMFQLAVNGNGAVPAEATSYPDRQFLDAYAVYRKLIAEIREYPIEGLLLSGGTLAVSGLMGSGKTTFLANAARSLATTLPFLGRTVGPASRVVVIASSKEYDNWCEIVGFWKLEDLIYVAPSVYAHFGDPRKTALWLDTEMQRLNARYFVADTLFDFFGTPDNGGGDENRKVMNEQAPLLEVVRTRRYSGLVGGHQPKNEAQAEYPRDPEEAFAGHTGWMAQHRMRISLRRKSKGYTAIISGRGGWGDTGLLDEQLLAYDPETRLIKLAGPFAQFLGRAALEPVIEALTRADRWCSRSEIEKETGKGKNFVLAGLKLAVKEGLAKDNGHQSRARKYALPNIPDEEYVTPAGTRRKRKSPNAAEFEKMGNRKLADLEQRHFEEQTDDEEDEP